MCFYQGTGWIFTTEGQGTSQVKVKTEGTLDNWLRLFACRGSYTVGPKQIRGNSSWPMLITTNKASVVSSALHFFFFFALCLNQYLEKERHSLPEPGAILPGHIEIEKEIRSPGWNQFCICFITVASGRVMKQGKSLGSFSKEVLKLSFKRRCFILEQCLANFFSERRGGKYFRLWKLKVQTDVI